MGFGRKSVGAKRSSAASSYNKHEESVAEATGAKRVVGSGRSADNKGDVKSGAFLFECKSTKYTSYSITADVWNKILREATQEARLPAMALKIEGIRGTLIVIRECDFVEGGTFGENESSTPDIKPAPIKQPAASVASAQPTKQPGYRPSPNGKVHYSGDGRRCLAYSEGEQETDNAKAVTCGLCRQRVRRR